MISLLVLSAFRGQALPAAMLSKNLETLGKTTVDATKAGGAAIYVLTADMNEKMEKMLQGLIDKADACKG